MKEQYIAKTSPVALEENCIRGERYRITLLTPRLARLEYDPEGVFEDRATQMAWHRDFPRVPYTVFRGRNQLLVRTEYFEIQYDEKRFSTAGLAVRCFGFDEEWRFGHDWEESVGFPNLKGTAHALDAVDGARELEKGVVSQWGIAAIDDKSSLVLRPDGGVEPRRTNIEDTYIFCYGHDYLAAVQDYITLCGKTPMLPRWALGNWWSRWHKYTDRSYLALMDRFERKQIPLGVAVLDMDWHPVELDPRFCGGWTGFSWNRELFPDPGAFLRKLHARGLHVTLNLHQGRGIRASEEAYPRLAAHLGADAEHEEPICFDPGDESFLEHYYEDVLHPLEDEGVDFWWTDYGGEWWCDSRIPGLKPHWPTNHYSFLDSGRGGKRPMIFSRYAGPGSHRFPIGFSGDARITWASLRFQPYFTATASNIGFGWWSNDIGGFGGGKKDDELMARWTQFGVFSPIMRLHCGGGIFLSKEPWRFGEQTRRTMTEMLQFRHRMIPYLYTMNHRVYAKNTPLMLPLYYAHPEEKTAYQCPNEYYFGSELLVCPVTSRCDPDLHMAEETIYLPDGIWHDLFANRVYRGGRTMRIYRPLDRIPVFAKAGAILPLTDEIETKNTAENPTQLHICVFLGAGGSFSLYEDDNETTGYQSGISVQTDMDLTAERGQTQFRISAARGHTELIPETRDYVLEFFGCLPCADRLLIYADGQPIAYRAEYLEETRRLRVNLTSVSTGSELLLQFSGEISKLENNVRDEAFALLDQAQIEYAQKAKIWSVIEKEADPLLVVCALQQMDLDRMLLGALTEILTAWPKI